MAQTVKRITRKIDEHSQTKRTDLTRMEKRKADSTNQRRKITLGLH